MSNPLDAEKPYLRRSLLPGLLGALAYNAARRQGDVRLFEVGVVFSHPGEGAPRVVERAGAGGKERAELPGERELLSAVFAQEDDDARQAVVSWHVLADAFRLDRVRLLAPGAGLPAAARPPPDALGPSGRGRRRADERLVIGAVGEIDPAVAAAFGLTRTSGGGTGAAPHRLARGGPRAALRRGAGAPAHHGGRRRQPVPVVGHRPGLRGRRRPAGRCRGRRAAGRRRRPARVGDPLRRLPGHRDRRGCAQPGLPAALLRPGPHADRRGGGRRCGPAASRRPRRSSAPSCADPWQGGPVLVDGSIRTTRPGWRRVRPCWRRPTRTCGPS